MYQLIFLSLLITLVSCSSSKETIFKEDMPTMKAVYEHTFHHLNTRKQPVVERPLKKVVPKSDNTDASPYGLAYQKLQQQFPKAPNPTMVMHVFRHLTASGTPVPGYNTYFTFYERDHFILSDHMAH